MSSIIYFNRDIYHLINHIINCESFKDCDDESIYGILMQLNDTLFLKGNTAFNYTKAELSVNSKNSIITILYFDYDFKSKVLKVYYRLSNTGNQISYTITKDNSAPYVKHYY